MTGKQVEQLRARVRKAIEKDGIGAVSRKVQVQPPTLLRFLSGAGRTNRGTVLQIEQGMRASAG